MSTDLVRTYLRDRSLPHFFCPGCGAAQVLNYFVRAADNIGLDFDRLVAIGGVGCTARIPVYLDADALHGVHGRTLAWATGMKLHDPGLKVVIFAGDGDAVAIGGNHLIHAARRNLDVVMIVVNNLNFGMTGGQVSPTTPMGARTTTTPYHNIEPPLKAAELVAAAGANYVARWTTYHVFDLVKALKYAIAKKGFSFLEIISQCPVSYGKLMGMRTGSDFLRLYRDNSIRIKKAQELSEKELKDKIVVGKLIERDEEEFTEKLYRVNEIQAKKLNLTQGEPLK